MQYPKVVNFCSRFVDNFGVLLGVKREGKIGSTKDLLENCEYKRGNCNENMKEIE